MNNQTNLRSIVALICAFYYLNGMTQPITNLSFWGKTATNCRNRIADQTTGCQRKTLPNQRWQIGFRQLVGFQYFPDKPQ